MKARVFVCALDPKDSAAAANRAPAQVPGVADKAFITNNGTCTVTAPGSVNPTIGSLSLGAASGT